MVLFSCNGRYSFDCFYWFPDKEVFEMMKLKQFIKGFKKGMGNFGHGIALVVNSVLLLIVYLVGVGFTFVFAKLFSKHFLDMKLSEKRESYWSDLDLKKKKIEEYYRQF